MCYSFNPDKLNKRQFPWKPDAGVEKDSTMYADKMLFDKTKRSKSGTIKQNPVKRTSTKSPVGAVLPKLDPKQPTKHMFTFRGLDIQKTCWGVASLKYSIVYYIVDIHVK